jgi:very-short-patch-repair endonuclease
MKRIANPVQTTELCSYGCGTIANFINGSNRLMCCKSSNSCPENKRKNSSKNKEAYSTGTRLSATEVYKKLDQSTKERMIWAKGLTKETNSSLANTSLKLKGRPGVSRPHTTETKEKLSKFRTEWLKNPLNRKNLGRHKRSWMELTFESYLKENTITGWNSEVHFWNEELRKNYFPDFIFESKKLIIELDGTQHKKTIEKDAIRDQWFESNGYRVIRITHSEFKERYFSNKGFLDLLGC